MSDPTPLYTAAQTRQFDSLAIAAGISAGTLMARAGAAAFAVLRARWPQARRIAVMCGVGNNAGDGFVLARLARTAGCDVVVLHVGDVSVLQGDALQALNDYRAAGGVSQAFDAVELATADVLVDALFGTGLTREVSGAWRAAIEAMNADATPVLA